LYEKIIFHGVHKKSYLKENGVGCIVTMPSKKKKNVANASKPVVVATPEVLTEVIPEIVPETIPETIPEVLLEHSTEAPIESSIQDIETPLVSEQNGESISKEHLKESTILLKQYIDEKNEEIATLRQILSGRTVELEQLQSECMQTKQELVQTKTELARTNTELAQVKASQQQMSAVNAEADCRDLVAFFSRYRDVVECLQDVDLDSATTTRYVLLLKKYGMQMNDASVLVCAALADEWDVAFALMPHVDKSKSWEVLRKMFANWENIRDRRRLKEFCVQFMKQYPTAISHLNSWAKKYSTKERVIRGYCDLCTHCQDAQTFAMQYSEL